MMRRSEEDGNQGKLGSQANLKGKRTQQKTHLHINVLGSGERPVNESKKEKLNVLHSRDRANHVKIVKRSGPLEKIKSGRRGGEQS